MYDLSLIWKGQCTTCATYLKFWNVKFDIRQLTAHTDDYTFGRNNLARDQVHEEQMAKVIRGEMYFESVFGLCVVLCGHDTSIVEQDFEEVNVGVDCLRFLSYRG